MLKTDKNINDVNFILDNLRDEDFEEITALWGNQWRNNFIENTMNTDFMILSNNKIPLAMGGFVPLDSESPRIACVWLLCSKYIKNNKILLFKVLKTQILKASSEFDILYNYIYQSNFEAKKWLSGLGFRFDNPFPENLNINKGFEFFYKINKQKG